MHRVEAGHEKGLVDAAFREIFGRPPTAGELRFAREYLQGLPRGDAGVGADALGALYQALLCSSQFLYLD